MYLNAEYANYEQYNFNNKKVQISLRVFLMNKKKYREA